MRRRLLPLARVDRVELALVHGVGGSVRVPLAAFPGVSDRIELLRVDPWRHDGLVGMPTPHPTRCPGSAAGGEEGLGIGAEEALQVVEDRHQRRDVGVGPGEPDGPDPPGAGGGRGAEQVEEVR